MHKGVLLWILFYASAATTTMLFLRIPPSLVCVGPAKRSFRFMTRFARSLLCVGGITQRVKSPITVKIINKKDLENPSPFVLVYCL